MKIVLYDAYKVGLLKNGNVVDVSGVVPRGGTPQLTIEGLITNFHIPSDLVVDRWASDVEGSSRLDFPLLHDV
jgi:hypothetical protein